MVLRSLGEAVAFRGGPRRDAGVTELEACFLWEEPGRDVDVVEVGEAGGWGPETVEVDPVVRFRAVLFPMPLFCPDRVLLEFVPILTPGLEVAVVDAAMCRSSG